MLRHAGIPGRQEIPHPPASGEGLDGAEGGSIDERDMLLEADPKVFHITEHYRNYPSLLVRIAAVEPDVLRAMFERNWREIAPKKLLKERDEAVKPR